MNEFKEDCSPSSPNPPNLTGPAGGEEEAPTPPEASFPLPGRCRWRPESRNRHRHRADRHAG